MWLLRRRRSECCLRSCRRRAVLRRREGPRRDLRLRLRHIQDCVSANKADKGQPGAQAFVIVQLAG
jgi:hypothetical protein